jgi:hypothetical protein
VTRVDQLDELGGVHVGPDQDERGFGGRLDARVAREPGIDGGGDLADVAGPLGEVRVTAWASAASVIAAAAAATE